MATTSYQLNNMDPEDIGDAVQRITSSLGLKPKYKTFYSVVTFGDLCDTIENLLPFEHRDDCTTQQAFYKLRSAISEIQLLNKQDITLDTKLEELFPRHNRRKKIKLLEHAIGTPLHLLTRKMWINYMLFAGFLISLIALFFNLLFGLAGLAFFALLTRLANRFLRTEFKILTLKALACKLADDHYAKARRHAGTMNKKEIIPMIRRAFMQEFDLPKEALQRNADLGW
jgi:hypothetical protein